MKDTQNSAKQNTLRAVLEIIKIVAIAVIITIGIRVFVAQPFVVSGTSMVPTFQHKNYLIIDELSYRFREPERGEVIVFRYPDQPKKFLIKRIIGLPEETVTIEDNVITITNEEHPEGFVLDQDFLSPDVVTNTRGDTTYILDENEYFVMGDNRPKSSDSRIWGPLRENLIVGRVWLRLLPLKEIDFLPGDFNFITNETNNS